MARGLPRSVDDRDTRISDAQSSLEEAREAQRTFSEIPETETAQEQQRVAPGLGPAGPELGTLGAGVVDGRLAGSGLFLRLLNESGRSVARFRGTKELVEGRPGRISNSRSETRVISSRTTQPSVQGGSVSVSEETKQYSYGDNLEFRVLADGDTGFVTLHYKLTVRTPAPTSGGAVREASTEVQIDDDIRVPLGQWYVSEDTTRDSGDYDRRGTLSDRFVLFGGGRNDNYSKATTIVMVRVDPLDDSKWRDPQYWLPDEEDEDGEGREGPLDQLSRHRPGQREPDSLMVSRR